MKDDEKETFEELFESLTETASDHEYSSDDDRTKTSDSTDDSEEYKSMRRLVTDELFSYYDIMNLKRFESLLWEHIISMGIIRPTRILHIGVQETYVLIVKNISENSLIYAWGDANGSDAEKMELCVCPKKGEVPAKGTEKIKITLTPMKEGVVQFLHVPCFVGNSHKIIMLGVECFIRSLYVTFYLPLNNQEPVELKNNFTRVEWHTDSLKVAFDMAERSKKGMRLLNKYRMREERELTNTNLDQGDVHKEVSAGPSVSDVSVENQERSSSSTRTSEIIRMSRLATENRKHSKVYVPSSKHIVPFLETILPPPTQPNVIEFLGLPLRTVEKKTFVIKNETPIPCNFRLRVKNFYPVDCSCERKSREDRIKFIYKQVYGRNKDLIEETLCRLKQPRSGVVIYVDPSNSDIGQFEAVPVDIYVFADTWGTYIDELDIDIAGLPRYTLAICVQVAELPISLSICERTSANTCVIKFGTVATGIRLQPRKISVKNTSVVPIAVDWHSFLVVPKTETMPFNVLFDLCAPFTDKMAGQLIASEWKSKSETCMEEHATNSVKSEIKSGSDSFGSNDSTTEVSSASPSASHEATTCSCTISSKLSTSWTWNDRDLNSLESSKSHEYVKDDIEFKISILPYYGAVGTKVCLVTPREIFISPKDNASVTITVQPHQCDFLNAGTNFTGELFCKILGFPRIAPSDKYRDNCYARLDGTYLTPIEIDVTANIVKPQLIFDIPTYDRTFACCTNDVMQSRWKALILKKTFFFYNNGSNLVSVSFATYNPFHIASVSIYAEANICSPIKDICINGHGCAEVVISCIVEEELIETLLHTNKIQDLHGAALIVKEPLTIIHSDNSTQEVELILHIWLPSLKLSVYTLEFGPVYVGNTKKLILVVENLSSMVMYDDLFSNRISYFLQ
ncbi:uncharacterized protein LOC122394952 [Colletes gigas]|uniref:uncharacterized protein LOC122394952 n=1 Tax=Colletes gigas TaxID=935657 RepID=UPI001C9AE71E|nr:uncharacterized protein LOC122394952 [Colletes gigas]